MDVHGRGTLTGNLDVDIHSLVIVDDRLHRAEIELNAVPPQGSPGTIDKTLLQWVTREILGLNLAPILPSSIEYSKLGMRLIIDDERLRLRGTHGVDGKTLLTIRLFSRDVPVIREFDRTYQLGPIVDKVRRQLEQYEIQQIRDLWEEMHSPETERR